MSLFFQPLLQPTFFEQKPYVVLTSTEYPLLWCAAFMQRLKKQYVGHFTSLPCESLSFETILSHISMSFLGQKTVFWLGNVDQLDSKIVQQLMRWLAAYQGPNSIILFTKEVPDFLDTQQVIQLPATCNKTMCATLLAHEQAGLDRKSLPVLNALFARTESLSLEEVTIMSRYVAVLGANQQLFVKEWLHHIISPESSLFTMSQYFFAKDMRSFFGTWSALEHEYPEQFWITFWSEQLWRAANVVHLLQAQQFVAAKSIAFRLPFSFMQRDWKKLSVRELQHAHAYVYSLDHAMKNGNTVFGLDRLYTKFLGGEFSASREIP